MLDQIEFIWDGINTGVLIVMSDSSAFWLWSVIHQAQRRFLDSPSLWPHLQKPVLDYSSMRHIADFSLIMIAFKQMTFFGF